MGLMIQPLSEIPGDHMTFIVDVTTLSVVRIYKYKVLHGSFQCLRMKKRASVTRYINIVKWKMDKHQMMEQLAVINSNQTSHPDSESTVCTMERINKQMEEIQVCAERWCCKLIHPYCCFSNPVKYWHMKCRSYKELINRLEGKMKYNSSIVCREKQHDIEQPKSLTMIWLKYGVRFCKARKNLLKKRGRGMWWVHFQNCLIRAMELDDKDKVKDLHQVTAQEESRKIWYSINRVTNDPWTGNIIQV